MTTTRSPQNKLISAVQELAAASSLDGLRAVLDRHRFLTSDETDRQLTRAIRAGLQFNAIATVSVLFIVRGFLAHLRRVSLKSALDAMGGVPLYRADSISQLIRDPQPSPHQVALCRRALKIVRRDTEPGLWAYLHFLLADRLMLAYQDQASHTNRQQHPYFLPTDRLMLDRTPTNIQEAMDAYKVASDVWEECRQFEQAAQARYELARLLIDFTTGEQRASALRRAIELLESTSTIWTRDTHPQEWGDVQAALGLALENMPDGLDANTLERAIGHYEAALQMPIDPSFNPSFELARCQYHLAILYAQRYRGDRVANVERAIGLLQDALKVRTYNRYPEEWADTQNGLANAFQQRLRGDPAQNIEQAIKSYQAALKVWTRDRNPARWAMIQRNLAEAYRHRILGRSDENQETAIACFHEALTIYTRQEHPTRWASVHNSLANLYCNRLRGDRADNIEMGIYYYTQALQVYTRDAYPRQWAQTANNLANAYCERVHGNHTDNLCTAIDLYEQVLDVRTRDVYPREWAATHNNIGTAYADLGQWKLAVKHFQKALGIRTVDALPDKALQTARNLGALHFGLGEWCEAIHAYRVAQEASDTLYQQAITEAGKRAEIGRGGEVAHHIAYALAQEDDPTKAVLELERGRARLLAEALARDRAVLDQADSRDQTEYEDAVSKIRALESELRAAELNTQGATDGPTTARPFIEIAEDLSSARARLAAMVKRIRQVAGYKDLAQPDFNDVVEAVQVGVPLVYLVSTPAGGLALIVHRESVKRVWLNNLTDGTLLEQVQRWFAAYFAYLKARRAYEQAKKEIDSLEISEKEKKTRLDPLWSALIAVQRAWSAILEDTTRWLWGVLMGALIATLRELGYDRATLIPTGLLAFLPLHAAWHAEDDGSPRHYALDEVAFAYAPSARVLIHAQRMATDASGETLFAVENPDSSLDYAAQEVKAVADHFLNPWVVRHERATRNTVLRALPQCDVYHFACHGNNNWQSPLESALWMFGQVPLTVGDLLGAGGRPQARLAFLSACETGLIGTELPDEVVGLAAGFVQAGAAGVVSTLWSVADESTALLAGRFYENWKGQGMSPLEALVAAQRWLRDEADGGRWAHPYYWAAFTLIGI